jgi:hypothetical protein
MDETALRIVISDSGQGGGGPPSPASSRPTVSPAGQASGVAPAGGPPPPAPATQTQATAPPRPAEAAARRPSAPAGGLFPDGFSSRGEVKTPLFPTGYASSGGVQEEVPASVQLVQWAGQAGSAARKAGAAGAAGEGIAGAAGKAAAGAGAAAAGVAAAPAAVGAIVTAISQAVQSAAPQFAQAGVALAKNDNRSLVTQAGNTAADVAGLFGPEGAAVGEAIKAVVAFGNAVADVTDAFVKRGAELARYSPELTAAGARADVRSIQSDIREAQELGPALARLTDAQSSVENDLREMLLPIKKFVVEVLAEFLESVADAFNVVKNLPAIIEATGETLAEAFTEAIQLHFEAAQKKIDELPDRLAKILKKDQPPPDLLENFFKIADEALGIRYGRPDDPIAQARDQRLNIPAFAGL